MDGQTIECDIEPARKLLGQLNAQAIGTILQAAAQGVRNAAIKHFRSRNSEPANSEGFPRFGESWPKSNFWSGVAKSVGVVTVQGDTATVPISSPALAHKADHNPSPITPKGGRKFLAIPANARAAGFPGMPRDFLGGDLRFGFAQTPEGRTMPALLATRDHMKTLKKGKNAGQRLATAIEAQQTTGHGDVQYWLVRKVQTKHDPEALPADGALTTAATRAAQSALNQLSKG
jgi:hypothetical protein